MKRTDLWMAVAVLLLAFLTVIGGCSGGGTGGSSGSGTGTTTVSGKVTLSASVVGLGGKPSLRKLMTSGGLYSETGTGAAGSPIRLRDATVSLDPSSPPAY